MNNITYSRNLLRKYFSDITYIDDAFDTSLVKKEFSTPICEVDKYSEYPGVPPIPVGVVEPIVQKNEPTCDEELSTFDETGDMMKPVDKSPLEELLLALNNETFKNIQLNPILYDENTSHENIVLRMQESPLSIIDWALGRQGISALPYIRQMLDTTSQLKVVIIYTAEYGAAKKEVEESFGNTPTKYNDSSDLSYLQCAHKSLVLIAPKQNHTIIELLDAVEEIFINNYGVMPTAIIDFSEKVKKKSGDFFELFCWPTEDIYFMQMFFSEIEQEHQASYLTSFILNRLKEDIMLEQEIINDLVTLYKNKLEQVVKLSENELTNKAEKAIEAVKTGCDKQEKNFLDHLKKLKATEYKESINNALKKDRWADLLKCFEPLFDSTAEKCVETEFLEMKKLFGINDSENIPQSILEVINKNTSRIKEKTAKNMRERMKVIKLKILPIFVQVLISDSDILNTASDLISNLKYQVFENKDLDLLLRGCEMDIKGKSTFLINKLFFGDLLCKGSELLLCITPPCDIFRPEKTKLNVSYLRGAVVSADVLKNTHKAGSHISIVPITFFSTRPSQCRNEEKIVYIEWRFYDIKQFNLKEQDEFQNICSYKRPARLDERYMRQIANKYVAYYSRSGVDEIFVKTESQLAKMFN